MLVKQKVKYIQTLGQKKFRQEEGLFIAEGPKLVAELLAATPAAVTEIYALKAWAEENKKILVKAAVTEITERELEIISQLTTPNKVLALVKQYDTGIMPVANNRITIALDNIQDPGNLGTIIRIADWFGAEQIICSIGSADVYNPKVVQSTMGSIARVKVYYTNLEEWLRSQKNIPVYAASLAGQNVMAMKKVNEAIIIIGNESKGISESVAALATAKITIPQKGKAESLNAAVAAGIILSHLV